MEYTKYVTFGGEHYKLVSDAYATTDGCADCYKADAIRVRDGARVKIGWYPLLSFLVYCAECEVDGTFPDESLACIWDEPDFVEEV